MAFKDEVKQALEGAIPDAHVDVDDTGGKVDAYVVSGSFEDVPEQQRQRKVWTVLEGAFTEGQRKNILFVFTATPAEDEALKVFPPNAD